MTLRTAVPALALLLCLPATAGASTIAGRVGGKVPKPGKGLAAVRAVGLETLVIEDVAPIRARPLSPHRPCRPLLALRGDHSVPRQGRRRSRRGDRHAGTQGQADDRAGVAAETEAHQASAASRLPKIPGLPTASAAFVPSKMPSVWVQHFSV